MAIWQSEFRLSIRRAVATSVDLATPALQNVDRWTTIAFPSDYRARLASVVPPAKSLHRDCESWGLEDGKRVDILVHRRSREQGDGARGRRGSALRTSTSAGSPVQFSREAMGSSSSRPSRRTRPLRRSDAWRFASDPAAFLAAHPISDEDE